MRPGWTHVTGECSGQTTPLAWGKPISHLNIFDPYGPPTGKHVENHLTRAFLSLIDLAPMAMAEFLEQLRDRLPEAGYVGEALLPRLSQVTQPIDLVSQEGPEAVDTEREWLVSVLMTDDHLQFGEALEPRKKGAIYDGVVTVGDHVVTLENKLHKEAVRRDQLNPHLPEERTIRWPEGARPVVLPWKEMIQALVNLRDGDHLGPAAAGLIGEFQEYMLEHFEYLNPYPTFAACRGRSLLLEWRCVQILRSLSVDGHVTEGSRGRNPSLELPDPAVPAAELFLHPSQGEGAQVGFIKASMHPGVTKGQCRTLFGSDAVDHEALIRLAQDDDSWAVKASLQWRFAATLLGGSTTELDFPSYLDYWVEHVDDVGHHKGKAAMEDVMAQFHDDGLLTEEEMDEVYETVFAKDYGHLNIYPGVSLVTAWPLEEAERLDDGGRGFLVALQERVEPVLEMLGQSLSDPEEG